MTLADFITVDLALILIGLALLFILQVGNYKSSLFGNLNSTKLSGSTIKSMPSLKELLKLESVAREKGSDIAFDSLIGIWRFVSVWKQGTDHEDSISSSLLRLFCASLELKKDETNGEQEKFGLTNSIQFGLLSIKFIGSGELKGSQPLLPFVFERIELKLAKKVLFSRLLELPGKKNRPFFALIAMEESGKWLSARGRGGGLALWLKD